MVRDQRLVPPVISPALSCMFEPVESSRAPTSMGWAEEIDAGCIDTCEKRAPIEVGLNRVVVIEE
jgi:hypothetical protein